jgi:hypothetical protein
MLHYGVRLFGCSAGSSSSVVESGVLMQPRVTDMCVGVGVSQDPKDITGMGSYSMAEIRSVLFSVLHQIKDPAPLLPCGSCTLLTNCSSFYQYKFDNELCFAISSDCCRWQAMDVGIR